MVPLALAIDWLRALAGVAAACGAVASPSDVRTWPASPLAAEGIPRLAIYDPNPFARDIVIRADGRATWFLPGCFGATRQGRAVTAPQRLVIVWEPRAPDQRPWTEAFVVVPWSEWTVLVAPERMPSFVERLAGGDPRRGRWFGPRFAVTESLHPPSGRPRLPAPWDRALEAAVSGR